MHIDRRTLSLGMVVLLAACSDSSSPPSPADRGIRRFDANANIVTHDFPAIQYPTGIANDGTLLYISTGVNFRETYVIDPTYSPPTVLATIPAGDNPRDVVFMLGRGLAYSDLGSFVAVRPGIIAPTIVPIDWRGGGIAHWRDTLYVGDVDRDSILVIPYASSPGPHPIIRRFATPTRNEGLVADSTTGIISTTTLWSISPFDGWMTEIDLQGNFIRRCNTPYEPGPFGLGGITLLRDSFYIAHPIGGDPLAGTRILRIARSDLVCSGSQSADSIDIKPGQDPNRVNPGSGQKIKVAVLTNVFRDATALIPSSVRFGRTGTEAMTLSTTFVDVDGDGDLDAVFEFRTSATGILCGDTSARLTATSTSGPPFSASDSIVTIGCGRP